MPLLNTSMQGKVCLITGTNSGIGKATALGLAQLLRFISSRFGSSEEGAQTSIYLASSPEVETISGKYFVKSVPRRSSTLSYDESLQRQLWEESAKLVNLPARILSSGN